MKKILILFTALIISNLLFCQSIQDYRDYLKERIESAPVLQNYKNHLAFYNEMFKVDVEIFVGRKITDSEYSNILMYCNEIFLQINNQKATVDVIHSCNMLGINKVTAYKDLHKNIEYYTIKIYMKPNYLCTTYSVNSGATDENSIEIKVNCDSNTSIKIKKAIIRLAQLSGNKDVYDGDSLFEFKK